MIIKPKAPPTYYRVKSRELNEYFISRILLWSVKDDKCSVWVWRDNAWFNRGHAPLSEIRGLYEMPYSEVLELGLPLD